MIAPEAACKNYGHEPTADDVQVKRYTSTWLAGLAVLLCLDADAYGWHCATNIFLLAAAVLTVSMPCFEQLGLLRRGRGWRTCLRFSSIRGVPVVARDSSGALCPHSRDVRVFRERRVLMP